MMFTQAEKRQIATLSELILLAMRYQKKNSNQQPNKNKNEFMRHYKFFITKNARQDKFGIS